MSMEVDTVCTRVKILSYWRGNTLLSRDMHLSQELFTRDTCERTIYKTNFKGEHQGNGTYINEYYYKIAPVFR